MNVYDSKRMADLLEPLHYTLTDTPDDADIMILNTCHIREKAEQKVYSDLGRLKPFKEKNKHALIAVGGCVGQAEGAEIIRQAPYVDIVFGPQTYHRLPEMIARAHRARDEKEALTAKKAHEGHVFSKSHNKSHGKNYGIVMTEFPTESKFDNLPEGRAEGASAFLSVQEGCDKFCTFCVVPYTRGAEFSRPVQDVLKEARRLVEQGVRDITLLGQNVNAYHGTSPSGKGEWGLGHLITELASLEGLERIRYMTSHPSDMHDDLYEAHAHVSKLMPYLHLPVQSGSDHILKMMNRKHSVQEYFDIIARLKEGRSDMAFSSDFIVGFPGESDKDFEATLDLIKHVHYAQAYSFKYSPRPGTPASAMELHVPEEVQSQRLARMQTLLNEQQEAFNTQCIGRTMRVLFEKKGRHEGQLVGKSPYMQSVSIQGNDRLMNTFAEVMITHANPNSLKGEIVTVESILTNSVLKL
jgi:tRNA-2-methylthio-N6-dimethylallyladenosine synthase